VNLFRQQNNVWQHWLADPNITVQRPEFIQNKEFKLSHGSYIRILSFMLWLVQSGCNNGSSMS
jgi:hypothetical protein